MAEGTAGGGGAMNAAAAGMTVSADDMDEFNELKTRALEFFEEPEQNEKIKLMVEEVRDLLRPIPPLLLLAFENYHRNRDRSYAIVNSYLSCMNSLVHPLFLYSYPLFYSWFCVLPTAPLHLLSGQYAFVDQHERYSSVRPKLGARHSPTAHQIGAATGSGIA